MKKLIYIDACIRNDLSRTKKIATPIIEALKEKYEVETFVLNDMKLDVVLSEEIERRNKRIYQKQPLEWALKIKEADRLVIATPFWDMSFPSALKCFLELCSILNVTFKVEGNKCVGNCNATKLLYITTRGMDIKTGDPLEQGTPYIKALSWLWGINDFVVLSRENFDYISQEEIEKQINSAIEEGLEIVKEF